MGGIHFWIAVVFLSVMALHLFLHWRWILRVLKGQPHEASGGRMALGLLGLIAVLAISFAPFGIPVEKTRSTTAHRSESTTGAHEAVNIRGRMTLHEIEQATGFPAKDLRSRLGMPPSAPLDVGVGKLGKRYGFDVDDVRKILSEFQSRE